MSNKLKNSKRLVEYIPNKSERRHIAMVREANKQGFKHPGSKPMRILCNIVPTAYSIIPSRLKRIFGK